MAERAKVPTLGDLRSAGLTQKQIKELQALGVVRKSASGAAGGIYKTSRRMTGDEIAEANKALKSLDVELVPFRG